MKITPGFVLFWMDAAHNSSMKAKNKTECEMFLKEVLQYLKFIDFVLLHLKQQLEIFFYKDG